MSIYPVFIEAAVPFSDQVRDALRVCLSPWIAIGRPVAIAYDICTATPEAFQGVALSFVIHNADNETTSWIEPSRMGLPDFLPLSAAALLLTTDPQFQTALRRSVREMAGDKMTAIVVPAGVIVISIQSNIQRAIRARGTSRKTADSLVRLVPIRCASTHERLKATCDLSHLVEFANSNILTALGATELFGLQLEMTAADQDTHS